jgi:hypothetical protein
MRTYLTVIFGILIIRFINELRMTSKGYEIIGNSILIVLTILGIVFVWNI